MENPRTFKQVTVDRGDIEMLREQVEMIPAEHLKAFLLCFMDELIKAEAEDFSPELVKAAVVRYFDRKFRKETRECHH